MKPPASKKQVQKLTGRLAALNRFISRSAETGLPFFRILQSSDHFEWGHEQQQAFDELKQYLTKLTTLSKPSPSATLMLYLATSPTTVSAVLVEAIGRIGKWATELNEFVVDFEHRSAIKSEALVDFIANWTPAAYDTTTQFEEPIWTVHCDGA